jgi:maintenance of morphology protein 1
MGEALTQGFSQMVEDLSGGNIMVGQDEMGDSASTSVSVSAINEKETYIPQPSKRVRRIPMPAGFPGSITSSGTPISTPGPRTQQPQLRRQQSQGRPQVARQHTHYLDTQADRQVRDGTTGNSTSMGGSATGSEANQFRFRGQFASQPGTPGVGQGRQLGVLNSRAG